MLDVGFSRPELNLKIVQRARSVFESSEPSASCQSLEQSKELRWVCLEEQVWALSSAHTSAVKPVGSSLEVIPAWLMRPTHQKQIFQRNTERRAMTGYGTKTNLDLAHQNPF